MGPGFGSKFRGLGGSIPTGEWRINLDSEPRRMQQSGRPSLEVVVYTCRLSLCVLHSHRHIGLRHTATGNHADESPDQNLRLLNCVEHPPKS